MMAAPTIDEMIEWLWRIDNAAVPAKLEGMSLTREIHDMLKQHQSAEMCADVILTRQRRPIELEAIRAFVERIMSKYDNDELPLAERLFIRGDDDLYHAMIKELAAMEKEAE
jgi:ketopantoate reductase